MKTALLLLEIQNDYFPNGRIPLEKSLEASAKARLVLDHYRDRELPIIHVQHISFDRFADRFLPCTKGAEFYSTVQPKTGEMIVKKHYPNSFKDTILSNYLRKNKITHLKICGMMTQTTVDATVKAAYDLGYACTVVSDACAARHLEFNNVTISAQNVHYAFLAALQPVYCNVISSDEFKKTSDRVSVVAETA